MRASITSFFGGQIVLYQTRAEDLIFLYLNDIIHQKLFYFVTQAFSKKKTNFWSKKIKYF